MSLDKTVAMANGPFYIPTAAGSKACHAGNNCTKVKIMWIFLGNRCLCRWLAVLFLAYPSLALASRGNPSFWEAYQINILAVLMTLLLYGFFALGLSILNKLLRRFGIQRRRWVIAPLAVVLLALPWAEEAWLAWRFSNLCQDAGLHVYKTVEVDGYFDSTVVSVNYQIGAIGDPTQDRYTGAGFKYSENPWSMDPSKIRHFEWQNGQWYATVLARPISRYEYRDKPTPKVLGLRAGEEAIGPHWWPKLWRREDQIFDRQTGEIIAQRIRYTRNPSVVNAMWSHFFGSGGTVCSGSGNKSLFPEVLRPSPNQNNIQASSPISTEEQSHE